MKNIIDRLNKIYSNSNSEHNIYTPLDLCDKMLNSLTDLSGDILVISNLEFLIQLKNKITLDKVYYATDCELKKRVAINLGILPNNMLDLQYNKEVIIATDMKFDIVVQNPPYSIVVEEKSKPIWHKFVEKGIDLLKDNGMMIAIHPASWRESDNFKGIKNVLKENVIELHICDYEPFKHLTEGLKVDWYLFQENYKGKQNIYYTDSTEGEILDLRNTDNILRISPTSIPYSILKKITLPNIDNGMILKKGWEKISIVENGKYKQWLNSKIALTNIESSNQFTEKVVMACEGKHRAKYFNKNEEMGVIRGCYWETNIKNLPILLNSRMLWKIYLILADPDGKKQRGCPPWMLRTLNFEGLDVKTEAELYEFYQLTQEEINWIEQ